VVDFKSTERGKIMMIKSKQEKQEEKKSEVKIDKKDEQIIELTDSLQRLQADFENYKKRVEKQYCDSKKYIQAEVVARLLPILDSFEMALKNTNNKEEFIKGVELIFSQLFQTLEDLGLKRIETNGKFDPYKHEVLLTQESDKDDNTILEELQKGYCFNDLMIRHSKVKISKKKKDSNPESKR
jgi:molecular chaperone GrpE